MAEPLITDETLRALYDSVAVEFGHPEDESAWDAVSDKRRELARLMRDLLRWWARYDSVHLLTVEGLASAAADAAHRIGLFPKGWDEASDAARQQLRRFAVVLLARAEDEDSGSSTPLDQIQDT